MVWYFFSLQILLGVLAVAYLGYFAVALGFGATHHCSDEQEHNVVPLVALTCVSLFLIVTSYIWSMFGSTIRQKVLVPMHQSINNHWSVLRWYVSCRVSLFLKQECKHNSDLCFLTSRLGANTGKFSTHLCHHNAEISAQVYK